MFLKPTNENDDLANFIQNRRLATEKLRSQLNDLNHVSNPDVRLQLAAILSWDGKYQETHDLLTPLISEPYPREIRFEARQMMADNHFRHDQYDLANRLYYENLAEAQGSGNEYWIARARDGIAWVLIDVGHYQTGEFEQAYHIFDETLEIHRNNQKPIPEAMGVYGLSRAAAGMGEYDQALNLARRSIEMLKQSGNNHLIQLPLLQVANVYRDHGSFDDATPFYHLAIDAADQYQDPYGQSLCAYQFGLMLKWTQQYKEAERIWRTALPIVSECNFPRLGSELCQALSTLASYTGSFEEAYRLQLDSQSYGNRVGVISPILQNQQMLLRSAMHETGQLENKLNYLTEGVEASEDGIFVLGAPSTGLAKTGFVIHFANNAAAQFLGKRPIEIMHVQIDSVWKSPSSQRLIEESLHVYSTGDRRSLEPIELEFTPGDHRLFSVKIAKTKQGVAWTVIDISEKEAMRQQIVAQRDSLEDANQKLIALNTEKNAMLGIAAHDLRSPIANVRSLCELIKVHDDESQKALSLIEATSESLLDLISNLLDVERIESGQYPFAHHSQKIAALIGPIVQQFEASAREKDISISVDFGTQDVEISVDEVSFCRIIQNLLSNALKFSPKGSKVGVRSYQHDSFVRIEIQDQGPGLTDEDKGLLFGKFARLSARPTAGEPSNGLGLPIVKHLVEAMGGTVGCESQFGHGATFWVQFPAQR